MSIDTRLAPLIQERAPWLFSDRLGPQMAKSLLDHALGYQKTVELGDRLAPLPAQVIMDEMATLLARKVTATGLGHLPAQGAALVVANHPTGIADAIMLHHAIQGVRQDTYFFANKDILRVLPQLSDRIAPVEWRPEKRSHASLRETMTFTKEATQKGQLGIIFPSGRLAKRQGLTLKERPWMASAAMLARKFELPVVPIHISARNSALFYLFDMLHASLRDITLFHETLNKAAQPFEISIGEAISPAALPSQSDQAIQILRAATLALAPSKNRKPTAPLSLCRTSKP